MASPTCLWQTWQVRWLYITKNTLSATKISKRRNLSFLLPAIQLSVTRCHNKHRIPRNKRSKQNPICLKMALTMSPFYVPRKNCWLKSFLFMRQFMKFNLNPAISEVWWLMHCLWDNSSREFAFMPKPCLLGFLMEQYWVNEPIFSSPHFSKEVLQFLHLKSTRTLRSFISEMIMKSEIFPGDNSREILMSSK